MGTPPHRRGQDPPPVDLRGESVVGPAPQPAGNRLDAVGAFVLDHGGDDAAQQAPLHLVEAAEGGAAALCRLVGPAAADNRQHGLCRIADDLSYLDSELFTS